MSWADGGLLFFAPVGSVYRIKTVYRYLRAHERRKGDAKIKKEATHFRQGGGGMFHVKNHSGVRKSPSRYAVGE